VLNDTGLQYMFTGAIAASYYGRPRTTLDIDIVIAVERSELVRLSKALQRASLVVHQKRLEAAWESDHRIVTLNDRKSAHTVDVIFTDTELDRIPGRVSGLPTYYEAAESLILPKLRMLKVTIQPERAATDRQDIKAILESSKIDLKSLRKKSEAESTIAIFDDLIRTWSRYAQIKRFSACCRDSIKSIFQFPRDRSDLWHVGIRLTVSYMCR